VRRKYEQTVFADDESSVGYAIDVFQESINKFATEYLVNFGYLTRLMEDYGFVLAGFEDVGISNTGMFKVLYDQMMNEVRRNPELRNDYGKATLMTEQEKTISFMNRYFIFKKTHSVEAAKVAKHLKSEKIEQELVPEQKKAAKHRVKRIRQVVLDKYEPIDETAKYGNTHVTPPSPEVAVKPPTPDFSPP
jgi:hypothetical protein